LGDVDEVRTARDTALRQGLDSHRPELTAAGAPPEPAPGLGAALSARMLDRCCLCHSVTVDVGADG
jgi:hypothetical protein